MTEEMDQGFNCYQIKQLSYTFRDKKKRNDISVFIKYRYQYLTWSC